MRAFPDAGGAQTPTLCYPNLLSLAAPMPVECQPVPAEHVFVAIHMNHQRTILGHPPGLYVLFLAQMWERFSFFGMLALLILYLNQFFKLTQDQASTIFMYYTTAVYFTPLLGGYLADRVLGNKRAVVIGAFLMAIGHFLMAFPSLTILITALVFLVVGCGLLTPPLTTQVGLLYAPNDPRRDSAYTIFYMGINLGAFASPLLCGWLMENTQGRFHSGFTLAGIGMVIALMTYVVGLRWVVEIDQQGGSATEPIAPDSAGSQAITASPPAGQAISASPSPVPDVVLTPEQEIEQTPSAWPAVNRTAPQVLIGMGALAILGGLALFYQGLMEWISGVGPGLVLAGISLLMFAWVSSEVQGGLRDRVVAILILGVFCVLYWAGAGQYGNVINLWAEQNTNRNLSKPLPAPDLFPEAEEEGDTAGDDQGAGGLDRWLNLFRRLPKKETEQDLLNPVPAAWFQSVNPLLIILVAPLFAMLWTWLARRGLNPGIPVKMALGLLLVALAFGVMVAASKVEGKVASASYPATVLPKPLETNPAGQVCKTEEGELQPYNAGRLYFDRSGPVFRAEGVFPELARDEVIRDTASPDFVAKLEELQKKSEAAAAGPAGWKVQVQLDRTPADFDLRHAGFGAPTGNRQVSYDPATRTLTTTIVLEDKEMKGLKLAAGDPTLRVSLHSLTVQANASRVSPWWLMGFFLLATLGEMCLSPVGLSMVSQLAPSRFAAMLMGMWLLTYAFGNYLAGFFGKQWGTWTPTIYFVVVAAVLAAATLLMLLILRKVGALMHEGK